MSERDGGALRVATLALKAISETYASVGYDGGEYVYYDGPQGDKSPAAIAEEALAALRAGREGGGDAHE